MSLPKLSITPYTTQEILDNGWARNFKEAEQIVKDKMFPSKVMIDDYQLGNGVTNVHIDLPADGISKLTIDMDAELNEATINKIETVINKN